MNLTTSDSTQLENNLPASEGKLIVYNFQEILSLITYSVITLLSLFLLVVLVRFFEVLGLLRDLLKRVLLHRNSVTDTLTQIRLFCQKYIQDPEE